MKQEFNWAMDQVKLPPEAEERILRALEEQKAGKAPRRPRRTWKTAVAAVAAAVLMTGTAFAAAYQAGVLDIFFRGDTSSLESYVQTAVGSAENEDYRFTVNSAYYDGMSIYAVITLEGLTDQAAERLFSNQVFADYYAQLYGQEEFDARDKSIMNSKGALVQYLIKLSDSEPGVEAETEIATYHKTISDIDRIADLAQNVMEFTAALKQNGAKISDTGIEELRQMREALDELKKGVEEEFERKDISLAADIESMEQRVDELYLMLEEAHLARMKSGECTPFTATIYIPLVNNLERIGDHLFNIFRGMKTYVKEPARAAHEEEKAVKEG